MRLAWTKGALALAVFALLLVGAASMAANTVNVQVLQDGNPVEGVSVNVMASDGTVSDVTDNAGSVEVVVNGSYVRVAVNGVTLDEIYQVSQGPIVIELN